MPKIVIINDVDEQNIAALRYKQSAHQIAKQYKISLWRVYDIWRRFNVLDNNLRPDIVDDLVKPAVEQIEIRGIVPAADQNIVDEWKSKITDLEDEIDEQKNKIDDLENIIDEQKSKIINLEDEIDEQKNKINDLENIIDEQKSKIDTYSKFIVDHKNRFSEQKKLIKNLKYEKKINNNRISDLCKINHRLTLASAQYNLTRNNCL